MTKYKLVHLRAIWKNINTTHSEWIREKTSFPITRTLFESPKPNFFMPISKKKLCICQYFCVNNSFKSIWQFLSEIEKKSHLPYTGIFFLAGALRCLSEGSYFIYWISAVFPHTALKIIPFSYHIWSVYNIIMRITESQI